MLAPPWIPVPPPGYGGIELVVSILCDALVRRGVRVTLFAAPGSRSTASVHEVLPEAHPGEIERCLHEVDHVACALAAVEEAAVAGDGYDVVHDHCGFTLVAMADRVPVPVVHTLHGPFTTETSGFYARHGHKAHLVGISRAQVAEAPPGLRIVGRVPNPIDVHNWPVGTRKDGYLLWIGRLTEAKGPHRAIAVARAAGVRLVLAGPVQPGNEPFFRDVVAPLVDGDRVRYVGEVGGERKRRLFAGAAALLMPIRWNEPFGMVMVEALACGTPVIAFREGAAPEIVQDGVNGFVVDDEEGMARAVARLGDLDPAACRRSAGRFAGDSAAAAYESVYRQVVSSSRAAAPPGRTFPFQRRLPAVLGNRSPAPVRR
jgi:glycosyltransferase involved in cell wall biosynthesis